MAGAHAILLLLQLPSEPQDLGTARRFARAYISQAAVRPAAVVLVGELSKPAEPCTDGGQSALQHTGSLMERWHTGEVAVFLDKCGLAHLQATFDKHRYSLDCLHGLDKEQLMGLGLTTLGERHKFLMVS